MNAARLSSIPLLAVMLAVPAAAQPLPERVEIGGGHMTVGFELKTTTHGSGPEGRTGAHSLMRYVQPKAGATWTEAERAVIERWSSLSTAERTAFFFKAYKGGHQSTNFEVRSSRYPFLDGTVSWYGSMNIPHIEVRSKPFDSPREAMRAMKALKADVGETIAFHMHLRFPDATMANRAEALTDWLRRASWAITLKRADYSPKTDFVLKSMDNQPINVEELNKALRAFETANASAQKDIIERRGLRVSRLSGSNGDGNHSIDIEFRGLMRDTGRLETYMRLAGEAFGSEGRVGPWAFDANSPFRDHTSNGKIKFRTFGWHGKGSWEPGELNYLANEVKEGMERFGITSRVNQAELAAAVKRLATADTEAGKKMLLPSSFNWLFLPLERDAALPEGVQEKIEKQKAEYLRKLVRLAERVHRGEFGRPGEPGYKPKKVATRIRRILHDFMNVKYADAGTERKLFEWYETSLKNPAEVNERTERWRGETGRNRAAEYAELRAARAAANRSTGPSEGEGFGVRRRGTGPARPAYWDRAEVERVFRGLRGAAIERAAALGGAADRAGLDRARNATLELVTSSDIDARYLREGNTVRVTSGLLNAIDAKATELPASERSAFRARALGLVLGHELAHSYGISAERIADREGLRLLKRAGIAEGMSEADIRRTLEAFRSEGRVSPWERLKGLWRYGSERSRLENLNRAARGEADPLAAYRRPNGTLDWKRLGAARATGEALGLAHFGLALFLKELAVVAKTGDRAVIEEFFDGLATTEFYTHYGLFVIGARAGEVAYVRFLERFVKPRFVSSILKTNLVLAAGLALPQIAEGTFTGRAFAISLGSLGLSSAAVKGGVSAIKWVVDLKQARDTGVMARLGLRASKFARIGGWFYTAAELAVVLYFADEIGERVNRYLDHTAAREALADASQAFFAALGDPRATPESVAEAAEAHHAAWIDYRDFLYRPLHVDEAIFAERLGKAAEEAKLAADRRAAALARLEEQPHLRARIEARFGSLEAYAERLVAMDEAKVARDVETYSDSYNLAREEHLREVYEENRRDEPLLEGLRSVDWLVAGEDDPFGARDDAFAAWGRWRLRRSFRGALEGVSQNRLETYGDEVELLEAAIGALERSGRGALAEPLVELRERVRRTEGMDERLFHGDGAIDATPDISGSGGLIDPLEVLEGR